MKKIHIVGILIIALALAAIISTISSSSTYANFKTADENQGSVYHVVGRLDTTKAQVYEPEVNANLFSFTLPMLMALIKKCFTTTLKPQDFEKAEQIVIVGKSKGDVFYAADILMKCPSKYNGNEGEKKQLTPGA